MVVAKEKGKNFRAGSSPQAKGALAPLELAEAAKIQDLYAGLPLALGMTIAIAGILAGLVFPVVDPARLFIWVGLMGSITFFRLLLLKGFNRARAKQENLRAWKNRFTVGVVAAGIGWGSVTLIAFPDSLEHQVMIAFVLGGMAAGSLTTLSAQKRDVFLFLTLALLPLSLRLTVAGEPHHLAMGGIYALFWLGLNIAALRIHRMLEDTIRLAFDLSQRDTALVEAEVQYRDLFENAQVGMFCLSADGRRFLDVNDQFLRTIGYQREELLDSISEEHRAGGILAQQLAETLGREGRAHNLERSVRTARGGERTVLVSGCVLRGARYL